MPSYKFGATRVKGEEQGKVPEIELIRVSITLYAAVMEGKGCVGLREENTVRTRGPSGVTIDLRWVVLDLIDDIHSLGCSDEHLHEMPHQVNPKEID